MKGANESAAVPHEFDGKRVLVTGGTRGIGQAITARLREAGARVLITARKPPSDLADENSFVATDITTAEGCAAVAQAVMSASAASTSSSMLWVVRQHLPGASQCLTIASGFGPRPESVPGRPAGSRTPADDARPRFRRDHSYHLDPECLIVARIYHRLCCRESGACELQ